MKENNNNVHAVRKYLQEELQDTLRNSFKSEYIEGLEVTIYVKDTRQVKWDIKQEFVKMYNSGLHKLITNEKITIEELGLLSFLSMYIDFKNNNVIAKNNGEPLSQKEIIELTKWSKSKVSRNLNNLMKNKIIYKYHQKKDKRKNFYFINPNCFFKGDTINSSIATYFKSEKL